MLIKVLLLAPYGRKKEGSVTTVTRGEAGRLVRTGRASLDIPKKPISRRKKIKP